MKINLGLVGFSWTPVHISYWTRWPKLPKVTYYYAMQHLASFYGLAYRYTLKVWDKRTDRNDGWRWQEQIKHVPVLGTWVDTFEVGTPASLHVFGLRFKIDGS